MNLNTFHVGHTYEVAASLASYLIVTGTAEPVTNIGPALVVRGTNPRSSEVMVVVGPAPEPDVAADGESAEGSARQADKPAHPH